MTYALTEVRKFCDTNAEIYSLVKRGTIGSAWRLYPKTTKCARRDSNSQPSDPKSFSVTLKPWIPCPIPKMTRRTPVSNFVECCDQYGPRPKLEPSAFLNSTRSRHSTCRSCGYDNPSLDTLRGMLVAQSIEPQTRTIAEARGIVCVEVDYDSLRGRELNDGTFFS